MRKLKIAFFAVILLQLLIPFGAMAATIEEYDEDRDSFTVDEPVEDDYYVSANGKLSVESEIDGDLLATSGNVMVKSPVSGDAYLLGGQVDVEEQINGNLYIFAGTADIDAPVEGSVFVGGGIVKISSTVAEDVMIFAGQAEVEGEIADDVRVFSGTADISGKVMGDVIAASGKLDVSGDVMGDLVIGSSNAEVSSAVVGGDLITHEGTKVDVSDSTDIQGDRIEREDEFKTADMDVDFGGLGIFASVVAFIWFIAYSIGLVLLGLLVLYVAPIKSELVMSKLTDVRENLLSFGIGCLALPFAIVIGLILLFSVIGIPVLLVLGALGFVAAMLTTVYVGYRLGLWIIKLVGMENKYLAMIVGVFLVQFLMGLPFIGALFSFVFYFLGLGAIVRGVYTNFQTSRKALAKK